MVLFENIFFYCVEKITHPLGGSSTDDDFQDECSCLAIATATSAVFDQWNAGDDDTLYVYTTK